MRESKKILNERVSTISREMFNSFSFFLKFDSEEKGGHSYERRRERFKTSQIT